MPLQLLPLQDTLVGGKYRLGPVIGSGGVGTVYRATHLWTEREVAIKVLDPSLPHFDQLREAFLREARATVQLDHPNVVDVLDMGEDDPLTTYLVMELLDGPTLRDVLSDQGRLGAEDTFAILLPLVDALVKAHDLGIVHRDFKPENIILSVDGFDVTTPKLLDFGVAQVLREARPHPLGAGDVIVGTPQYMSPEQARDQQDLIGPHTDVWGVGVVWYECLTGHPPFDGDTAIEVLTAVCEAPVDFSEVPETHVPILRDALERSPKKRIQSLSALRARIESAGLVAPVTGTRAKVASWPSPEATPSYVHRTLHGVGPDDHRLALSAASQVDSELIHLPRASHRKALLGGAALAFAVGLAAWWTIRGLDPMPPAAEQEPPSIPIGALAPAGLEEPTETDRSVEPPEPAPVEPAPSDEPESPVAANEDPSVRSEDAAVETTAERQPRTESPADLAKAPERPAESPSESTPAPAAARSEPTPARTPPPPPVVPPSEGAKKGSGTASSYDKPPELVTEW